MNLYQLVVLLGASLCACDGIHVLVRENRRLAMLFQPVVLPCQYQTSSKQTPVVQWWYKSYCRDHTRESFTLSESLALQAPELRPASHLECSDSGRTVRVVASAQGASMTLAEHYKGRDIAIINRADLRIGEVQWGDSGVYFCKIIIADDLEGKNEGQVELLVLEWVFVGCVVLGGVLVLLLLGICWCQCCPHSCCCYVRCCCCPDTCCCPRHLYEAGKKAKVAQPAQVPVYPYYIPGVPAVVPLPPPSSHMDPKLTSIPSVENNLAAVRSGYRVKSSPDQDSMKVLYYVEKELAQFPSAKMAALKPGSLSELSSLHDGGTNDFRHTYQTVQMKALPPIADHDERAVARALPPSQSHRARRDRGHLSDDELDRWWDPHSEHLKRKTLGRRGRTGSLDELEEFARSYSSRGRRAEPPGREYEREYGPPRRFHRDEDEGWGRRSPSPLPQKRRDTWDSERPSRPPPRRDYDDAFLASVLESKARGRGGERVAGRTDEDSDTPSKGSSRGKGSDSYYSRSPSNRPEEEDALPPYSEREAERHRAAEPHRSERYRTSEAATRPFSYTRPHRGASHTLQGDRQDRDRDRSRNLSRALSRDTLVV